MEFPGVRFCFEMSGFVRRHQEQEGLWDFEGFGEPTVTRLNRSGLSRSRQNGSESVPGVVGELRSRYGDVRSSTPISQQACGYPGTVA